MKTIYLYIHKIILSVFKRPSAGICLQWKSLTFICWQKGKQSIITNTDAICVVTLDTWRKEGLETTFMSLEIILSNKEIIQVLQVTDSFAWQCLNEDITKTNFMPITVCSQQCKNCKYLAQNGKWLRRF